MFGWVWIYGAEPRITTILLVLFYWKEICVTYNFLSSLFLASKKRGYGNFQFWELPAPHTFWMKCLLVWSAGIDIISISGKLKQVPGMTIDTSTTDQVPSRPGGCREESRAGKGSNDCTWPVPLLYRYDTTDNTWHMIHISYIRTCDACGESPGGIRKARAGWCYCILW